MYNYQTERKFVFTEEGQIQFLRIRDRINGLLKTAGAFQMGNAIAGETGITWEMMACVDRLVEIGEIQELRHDFPGQYRTFIKAY